MKLRDLFKTLLNPAYVVLAPEGYSINKLPPQGLVSEDGYDKDFENYLDCEVVEIMPNYDYRRDGTISLWLDVAVK